MWCILKGPFPFRPLVQWELGYGSGCSCPLSYWNEAGWSVIAQRRPSCSLSWLYVRDKIARYLYISLPELLCGRLTQAKWTEPLPIRDLVLFNIAHAQMKLRALNSVHIRKWCARVSARCVCDSSRIVWAYRLPINHAFSHLKQLAQCHRCFSINTENVHCKHFNCVLKCNTTTCTVQSVCIGVIIVNSNYLNKYKY